MKKFGFTLAEVLITLGIIGVVAALTLPTLTSNTTEAQIGPKLAKTAAMLEQAHEAMLNRLGVDSFSDANLVSAGQELFADDYFEALEPHLKFVRNNENVATIKDGTSFNVAQVAGMNVRGMNPSREWIGFIDIDINGINQGEREFGHNGTDVFQFTIFNDGSLMPYGATGSLGDSDDARTMPGGELHWTTRCPLAENGNVNSFRFCAGHIFENNLRVLYR